AGREIGAGAEAVAGAGDDEHAVARRVGDLVEHVDELAPHRAVDGVLLLGAVQREGDDAVRAFDDEGLHPAATVAPWASTRSGSRCGAPPTSSSSSPLWSWSRPWSSWLCSPAAPGAFSPLGPRLAREGHDVPGDLVQLSLRRRLVRPPRRLHAVEAKRTPAAPEPAPRHEVPVILAAGEPVRLHLPSFRLLPG